VGTEDGHVDINRSKQDEVWQSRAVAPFASYEREGVARSRAGHGEAYMLRL